ncbi:MAG: hypothetical protein IPM37_16015 [Hahellaceae bacterium]|nr:hypothetical protein [Hahellaceae bacterium]
MSIERNKIGDVTSVSLGGLTRSYAYYDGTRRLRTITEPERGMVTLNYDAAGNLRTKLLAGANASPITYGYDSLNRLTSETYPDSTTGVAYTYDGANRLESTTSGLVSRGYQYEPWGALKTETVTIDDKSFELGYGYNGQGSLESITYPNNEVVSLSPDDWGRPTQVGNFASAISYYANDAAKSFTYGNGQVVSISQNNKQFVDGIASAMGAVVSMSQSYTFDEAGNITSIKESVNGDSTLPRMTYDGLNRLRDADGPWGTGRIDYDVKDNITKKRFGYYVLDYTYDATSNRLKSTRGIDYYPFDFTYDTQGNVTGNGRHQFNYDLAGRLISIDPSANQTVAGNPVSIDYLYDGHGFRALEVRDNRAFYQVHDKSGDLMYETNADDSEQSIYVRFNGQTIAKQDSCTNECTGADGAPVGDFGANADGQIVLEAEHFTSNAAVTNGHSWIEKSNSAYSGGVSMEAKPEDTIRYEEDKLALCPRMDYAIDFPSPGTYYVWVRGVGPNGSSDSLHIGLDGQTQAGSVKLSDYLPLGSLRWGHLMNGTTTPITLNVSSAGLHTLNVWMRESGMIADKIVLTQDANFVPAGSGPDETTHELLPNNTPVVTSAGLVEAQVGVVYAYDLVATDADNDGLNYRLTTAPTGMTITKYSGQIRWTPVQGQEGSQSVVVEVTDGKNPVTQAFTISVKAKDPVFQVDESGMVVIEAEHYLTQRASFDGYPWQKMANAAASNGEHILINDAATVEFPNGYEGFVTDAAAATYKVNFPAAGTWYVWVRGNGPDGTSDSLHVGIDGTPDMAMSALTGFYPREAWAWGNKENATKVAVYVTVPTAGEHVFNIWMRESGLGVDKFILTQNSAYKPGASTLGPVESRQE